jgi:predicted nucleotidyltransferase
MCWVNTRTLFCRGEDDLGVGPTDSSAGEGATVPFNLVVCIVVVNRDENVGSPFAAHASPRTRSFPPTMGSTSKHEMRAGAHHANLEASAMVDATSLVSALRTALKAHSNVVAAFLFGSFARSSAVEGSDVDIAVVGPNVDPLALGADLSSQLGREVDVVVLGDAVPIPLLEAILRDGIVVHEREGGDAALFRSRTLATLETDRPGFARMRDAWLRRVAERGL